MSDIVYIVVRYLPLPCDVAAPRPARRESRHDPLLDLALLRFVIDPIITPDEEHALVRLCAARLPVVIPGLESAA
jgi:hypothetical protein